MTELSGILEGVGLPAIVRFLAGLNKTGSLELDDGDWRGKVAFDQGEITDATFGTRTGLAALEAMVEVLPGAHFAFDSNARPSGEPSIRLGHDSVLAHLDEAAARCARGAGRLPQLQLVPTVVTSSEANGEEPLPLDRASLQTLLVVDGQRSVRQIAAERGSIDALWQLANLADVGLISLTPKTSPARIAVTPAPAVVAMPQPLPVTPPRSPVTPTPVPVTPPTDVPAEPGGTPEPPQPVDAEPTGHCPRLGFEDDPGNSFGRPTRLHRCFASATALPLSLDQQRELCLTAGFGACPRLTPAAQQEPEPVRAADPRLRGVRPRPPRIEYSPGEDGRIVRLPTNPGRDVPDAAHAAAGEPMPIRPGSVAARNPTPLRARLDRPVPVASRSAAAPHPTPGAPAAAAAVAPVATAPVDVQPEQQHRRRPEAVIAERQPAPAGLTTTLAEQRPRIIAIAVGAVALVLLAVIGYIVAPQLSSVLGGDSVDTADLPNASRIAAGTPVTAIAGLHITPIATTEPTVDSPVFAAATAVPTPLAQPTLDQAPTVTAAAQAPTQAAVSSPAPSTPLFDERFATNDANWPSDPQGAGLVTNGTYRMTTHQVGQFAAITAPIANVPADAVVSASFRKLGGPAGGGYGIIVRDQDPSGLNGTTQDGHYYVLEAGDKGEVGIWRRDGDHWVDLLPWQHADTVKSGNASNDLSVRVVGNTLTFSVNGTQVATRTDATLTSGGVGLFVGGDGNQVAISHFSVEVP